MFLCVRGIIIHIIKLNHKSLVTASVSFLAQLLMTVFMNANQFVKPKVNAIVVDSHPILPQVWNELIVHVTCGYKFAQPVFCNAFGCMNAVEGEEFGNITYRSETVFVWCGILVIIQSNE